MQLTLDDRYRAAADHFFTQHPIPHEIKATAGQLTVQIDDSGLMQQEIEAIRRHFRYLTFFTWQGSDLDDVIFWERPSQFKQLVRDFTAVTADLDFDLLAALEARGFLLAGLLAGERPWPILPIRKYKPFYQRFPGVRVDFNNWKGEAEALFLFSREIWRGRRVLIVDDLIETGNSLEAALRGLTAIGCEAAGAFYLGDFLSPTRRPDFSLPLRAFVNSASLP
jgi:adenine phosphoribosyltransferase